MEHSHSHIDDTAKDMHEKKHSQLDQTAYEAIVRQQSNVDSMHNLDRTAYEAIVRQQILRMKCVQWGQGGQGGKR